MGAGIGGKFAGIAAGSVGVGAGSDARGVILGGVGAGVGGTMRGLIAGGIGVGANEIRGAAIGGFGVGARHITGTVLTAGLMRIDEGGSFHGFSLNGSAGIIKGTQRGGVLGLFNYARRVDGFQIGLLNIIADAKDHPILPLVN